MANGQRLGAFCLSILKIKSNEGMKNFFEKQATYCTTQEKVRFGHTLTASSGMGMREREREWGGGGGGGHKRRARKRPGKYLYIESKTRTAVPPLFCSLLSFPSSPFPSQPGDVCRFVHVVLLTLSPRSEARRQRVGLEVKQVWLSSWNRPQSGLKVSLWRASLLVSMARHKSCVHRRAKRQTTRA